MKRKSFSFMTMAVCAISAALGGISYSSRMNQTSLLLKENLDALSDDNKETKKYRAYRCYLHEDTFAHRKLTLLFFIHVLMKQKRSVFSLQQVLVLKKKIKSQKVIGTNIFIVPIT